jgi:hypothetical protein
LFLPIDAGLFLIALWQGIIGGSILTALIGGLIWLTSKWTGCQPEWLLLWLGITSALVLFCRVLAKCKGLQAWTATPAPGVPIKTFKTGEESPNLHEWQKNELARHRQIRACQKEALPEVFWTTSSTTGKPMTEFGNYWARIENWTGGKYAFTAYSKGSGAVATAGFDYETERDAMVAAERFMRDGKDPMSQA